MKIKMNSAAHGRVEIMHTRKHDVCQKNGNIKGDIGKIGGWKS